MVCSQRSANTNQIKFRAFITETISFTGRWKQFPIYISRTAVVHRGQRSRHLFKFVNSEMEERVLDAETWPAEAEAAINDIRKHVASAQVAPALRHSDRRIYINLTTLENCDYCIEMSAAGFRVVGRKYDDTSLSTIENMNYETPYALLNSISQKYRESFGGELMNKLLDLEKNSKG